MYNLRKGLFVHIKKPKYKHLTFLHFAKREGVFHEPRKGGIQFKCCYASHYIIFHFQISCSSKTWQPLKIKNAIRQGRTAFDLRRERDYFMNPKRGLLKFRKVID